MIDKILNEISWLYDKGYPDFSLKEDREILYDYLTSMGIPYSEIVELSQRLVGEDDEWWTKMSLLSSPSVVTKPKPERLLNHLTIPCWRVESLTGVSVTLFCVESVIFL